MKTETESDNLATTNDPDAAPRWEKPNVFFWLVLPPCMLFVITLFSVTAARMGAREAPINAWLDRFAGLLMTGEVIAILLFAFLAMATDRRRMAEQRASEASASRSAENGTQA